MNKGDLKISNMQNEAIELSLIYGSRTGNGGSIAEKFKEKAEKQGIKVHLKDMFEYPVNKLIDEKYLLVIISTHGEGEPPIGAEEFYNYLHGQNAPDLSNIKYAVLALGDKRYIHYCKVGIDIDKKLEELGAQRFFERVDCDLDFKSTAENWVNNIIRLFENNSEPPSEIIKTEQNIENSKKIYFNRRMFVLHHWLGLFLGIFYLLISICGASVVFVNELTQWVYGSKMSYELQPGKKTLSYDKLYEIAKSEFPDANYYVLGSDALYPENAYFVTGIDARPHKLFTPNLRYSVNYVNPYTGKVILRTNSKGKNDFFHWLVGFHDSFQLGGGGELFVAIISIALILSIITGFIFYRKYILKVLLFKVRIKYKNKPIASSDLHQLIGTWALIINFMIFFSGFYLYKNYFTTNWWEEYTKPKTETQISSHDSPKISMDTLVERTNKILPEMIFESISIPKDTVDPISLIGITKEKLFLDADNYITADFYHNGTFKAKNNKKWREMSFSEKFDSINFQLLHTGWALGFFGKIIWTILGFAPAALSITGFLLWRRKKKINIQRVY